MKVESKSNVAQGFTIQAILKAISGSDLKFLKSGDENRTGVFFNFYHMDKKNVAGKPLSHGLHILLIHVAKIEITPDSKISNHCLKVSNFKSLSEMAILKFKVI